MEMRPPLWWLAPPPSPQLRWWDYGCLPTCHMTLWRNVERFILSPGWGGKGTGFLGSLWATENPVTRFPLGKGSAVRHQRGPLFHRPPGRLYGFIIMAPLHFQRAPHHGLRPPERQRRNPWHQGPSGPMDAICPSAAQRQPPSGIQTREALINSQNQISYVFLSNATL